MGNGLTIQRLLLHGDSAICFVGTLAQTAGLPPTAIAAAEQGWQTLNAALNAELPSPDLPANALDSEVVKRFQSAMDDDLNTAAALAVLFELAKSIQREVNRRTHQSTQQLSDQQLSIPGQTLTQLAFVLGTGSLSRIHRSISRFGLRS